MAMDQRLTHNFFPTVAEALPCLVVTDFEVAKALAGFELGVGVDLPLGFSTLFEVLA